ncbi:MAG: M3 family metallopeptidase [Marinilabiliaceae bacterium]|nr:M3 family metallopeptidase [Marinilabiliaceae bacterium]
MDINNPLLNQFNTPHGTVPFNEIKSEHFMPAFLTAMELGRAEINEIVTNTTPPTFENTIEAIESSGELLNRIQRIFFNLNSAETNDEIKEIAREISPMLSDYNNDIYLNEQLFERVKIVYNQVFETKEVTNLNSEQKKLLDNCFKNFVRKGALLDKEAKDKYRKATSQLATLTVTFGENLLNETNEYKLHITNPDDMSGIPTFARDAAAEEAQNENLEGWIFTLDAPSYTAFMKYADNRNLRKELFMAFATRCNKNNKFDNKDNILKISSLRNEVAQLLGYETFADYTIEERMAQTTDKVNEFLDQLLDASFPFAQKEVIEVENFAKKLGFDEKIQRWDFSYYSEKLKESKFNLTDEMTKPYFELQRATSGIFNLTNKLWGISYKQNSEIQTYHPDVKAFEVFDKDGSFLAVLYLDFHPRSTKRGGAWMTVYKEQKIIDNNNIRPHITIVCNFTPPVDGTPSLLTHSEFVTFLHEFGHALHGIFSNVTYQSLAGTSVYQDFVELPSQIMENWAFEKEWLKDVAIHYQTGEAIPDDLINKIIDAGNFQSGYLFVRQLSFGFNDMAWHSLKEKYEGDVQQFEKNALAKTELFPDVEENSISTSFRHVFSGGYAAGYYSYKWAEVLDADAFDLFKQNGIFDQKTADSFRNNILSKGGTEHPMDLYVKFRGQEPDMKPLLIRSGLVE